MAALVDMGRVALDVLLAVGPMMSSEHVAKNQHVVQMRHSRLESFREDVRDLLSERLDSSQNLTLKSTLLFGFVTAILVEGFPSRKMKSEMCVDLFIFMVPWGVCLLFQSMTFAVLYQRGMVTVGHRHLRELQRIGAKQAEEELEQGNETFAEIISAKVRRTKERQGVLGVLWAVVARFFALPGPNELKRGMVEEDTDKEDFCSLASDTEVERSKSDVLSLDYLTQRLQGSAGAGSPVSANPKGAVRLIPNNLVHVTEMSKMPEVAALDLYEEQSHLTVVGGGLFTLMSLSFLVVTQLQMRAEVYEDHPMAFAARCGIFLPPLMVAGFASFIRPFPGKLQHEMPEDSINPHYIRPMTQCVVMVGAVISCTCLALALQLHTPPVAVGLTVTELSVDRWPLFFNPSGLVALEDSLLVTTDYRFARFKTTESSAVLLEEHNLPGVELADGALVNDSVLLAGRKQLLHLDGRPAFSLPDAAQGDGREATRGLAYWPQGGLLFLAAAAPLDGVVAARLTNSSTSLGLDFRLPVRGAVSGLAVDEEHQVLHVMFPEELQILDLRHQPGALLHRYRLPSFADPAKENPLRWSGIASAGHRLFAVTHSPAQLFCIQLPPLRPCGLRSCRL